MFSVIDTNGNIKAGSGGTGANLADPLPVVHGGTGLTFVGQSEMLYALHNNDIERIFVDTDLGTTPFKVMYNGGSVLQGGTILNDFGPRWGNIQGGGIGAGIGFIPRPGSFISKSPRVFWGNPLIGTSGFASSGLTLSSAGTQTIVTDSTTVWSRNTTGAADTTNVAGATFPLAQPSWLQHNPNVAVQIRTPSNITNIRLLFVLSNRVPSGNTDDLAGVSGDKGIGIRYSTVAGDTGWTAFTLDGTVTAVGPTIASISASTVYLLQMQSGAATVGEDTTFSVGATSVTMPTPGPAFSLGLSVAIGVKSADASNTKFIDIASVWESCQIPF